MVGKRRATRGYAFGYGTALAGQGAMPMAAVQPLADVVDLYTGEAGDAMDEQRKQSSIALQCPSSAECAEQLGKNVFAYRDTDKSMWTFLRGSRGPSVVKVFSTISAVSMDKLTSELRAYRVLKRLHTEKGALEPLWVEELTSKKWTTFDSRSLRIERHTPWKQLKDDAGWGDDSVIWSLVDQVSKMHESGVAHGDLSVDTIGFVGSVGAGRFVVSGASQVVSPLSEFYEGDLRFEMSNDKGRAMVDRVRGILRNLLTAPCKGGLRCRISPGMIAIHGDGDDDNTNRDTDDALKWMLGGHDAFLASVDRDVKALNEIFRERLVLADPAGVSALWSTFNPIEKVWLGLSATEKKKRAERAAMAERAERAARAERAERAERAARAERAEREKESEADAIKGCEECGEYIAQGFHGAVYEHRKNTGKVVKVFKPDFEPFAAKEARAYEILNKVSASDPSFRSITAKLLSSGNGARARLEIDKLKGVLVDYTGEDRVEAGKKMETDGVSYAHFRDLVNQIRILHRHGVVHGDVKDGNIGLVEGGFVIVDPTLLKVSPLSDLYDEPIEPNERRVLDALRKATKQGTPNLEPTYRYVLSRRIDDLNSDRRIGKFLLGSAIDASDESIKHARSFIEKHNGVALNMREHDLSDLSRMNAALSFVATKGPKGLLDELYD
jgi:hypothetical protein